MSVLRVNKLLVLLVILVIGSSLQARPGIADDYHFEVNANVFREGETIEIGFAGPSLFTRKSRNYWSLFGSAGVMTLANVGFVNNSTFEAEVNNIEAIFGLSVLSSFYKDFIFQYGKIAVSHVVLDDQFSESSSTGALLESGLEFKANHVKWGWKHSNPLTIYMGLRWRFLHEDSQGVVGEPNLLNGVSFVIGSRLYF